LMGLLMHMSIGSAIDTKISVAELNAHPTDAAVNDVMKGIDIPKLVKRSKAAMAKKVLGISAKKEQHDDKTATMVVKRADQKEDAVKDKALKVAVGVQKATKETAEKTAQAAKETSQKKVEQAKQRGKAAVKLAKQKEEDAKEAVNLLKSDVSEAEHDLHNAINGNSVTAIQAAKTKIAKLNAQLDQKKQVLLKAKHDAEDADADATDAAGASKDDAQNSIDDMKEKNKKEIDSVNKAVDEAAKHKTKTDDQPQSNAWRKNYDHVVAKAKESAKASAGDSAPPGKPKHVERSEKAHAVTAKANGMIKKLKVLNTNSKQEQAQKEKAAAEKKEAEDTNNQVKKYQAEKLAAAADKDARLAATAALNIAKLKSEQRIAKKSGTGNVKHFTPELKHAKALEIRQRKRAEKAAEAAKDAEKKSAEQKSSVASIPEMKAINTETVTKIARAHVVGLMTTPVEGPRF